VGGLADAAVLVASAIETDLAAEVWARLEHAGYTRCALLDRASYEHAPASPSPSLASGFEASWLGPLGWFGALGALGCAPDSPDDASCFAPPCTAPAPSATRRRWMGTMVASPRV